MPLTLLSLFNFLGGASSPAAAVPVAGDVWQEPARQLRWQEPARGTVWKEASR